MGVVTNLYAKKIYFWHSLLKNNNKHIVNLVEYFEAPTNFKNYLVTEYAGNRTLEDM